MTKSAAIVLCASSRRLLGLQHEQREIFSGANLGAFTQGLLTEANLQRVVGTLFMVFLDEYRVSYMRLREVSASSPPPLVNPEQVHVAPLVRKKTLVPGTESFLLVFNSDTELTSQGSYVVDHGTLGRFTLFMVPGGQGPGQTTCVCTFNYVRGT